MSTAPPAASVALGPVICSGGLRVKGIAFIVLPPILVAAILVATTNWVPFMVAVVIVLVGLLGLAVVYCHRQSGVYGVHRDGLVIVRGWRLLPVIGHGVEVYRWAEVATISRRITSHYMADRHDYALGETHFRYVIGTADGRRLILDSRYGDIAAAGEAIMAGVRQCLLPQVLARYDRGDRVAFGPITASRDGLTWEGHFVPWPGIVAASVKRGILTLECRPAPRLWRTALAKVANADCFFALLAERQPQVWVAANPAHFAEIKRIGPKKGLDA